MTTTESVDENELQSTALGSLPTCMGQAIKSDDEGLRVIFIH